jgi:fumarate hydratase class I
MAMRVGGLRAAFSRCCPAHARPFASAPDFAYSALFQAAVPDATEYRKLTSDFVKTIEVDGEKVLKVDPEALRLLSATAMTDIAHLLRTSHLEQLAKILGDDEATPNDKFVALELLKNANVAAGRVLPSCQVTSPSSSPT